MMLDRRGLATLVAVVDEGTFELAARALHVTPSAVSQRIKALEVEQGRVLVERTKPVRATEPGEALVRLGRQLALLEDDALRELGTGGGRAAVPLAVNADSLATWLLPALARAARAHPVTFELLREDEDRTTAHLASGRVMAAITTRAHPVAGCVVTPLGRMRYRPMASPDYLSRYLPEGPTTTALAEAPLVDFDRDDGLQDRWLRKATRRALRPPRHYVAASGEFARAVELGMGWGMLPDAQSTEALAAGRLVPLAADAWIDVPLHWQQWRLRTPVLDAVAAEVVAAARAELVQPRGRTRV
jgi:LysR family transcriptional regulator (chromosome initiation inhibitor)